MFIQNNIAKVCKSSHLYSIQNILLTIVEDSKESCNVKAQNTTLNTAFHPSQILILVSESFCLKNITLLDPSPRRAIANTNKTEIAPK